MSTDPKKMKVDELKHALKERGLSTTGLKAELVDRLEKALSVSPTVTPATSTPAAAPSTSSKPPPTITATKPIPTTTPSTAAKSTTASTAPTTVTPVTQTPKPASVADTAPPSTITTPTPSTNTDDSQQVTITKTGIPALDAAIELKRKRAEKFGTPLELNDAEKKAMREARFGGGESQSNKKAKLNSTAATTNTNTTTTPATATAKPSTVGEDPEKLAARAKKFGLPTPPTSKATTPTVSNSAKPVGTGLSAEDEAKKKARADRFAGKA